MCGIIGLAGILVYLVAALCVVVLKQTEFKRIPSPLKYQTRCVATFPGKEGFLVSKFLLTESFLRAFSISIEERMYQFEIFLVYLSDVDVGVYCAGWIN